MKTIISILIFSGVFILNNYSTHAQTPDWFWAHRVGGTFNDFTCGIATDGSGNSIVTGSFYSVVTFGDTTFDAGIGFDIFIAKLDANGNFLWAAQAGAGGFIDDIGRGIATDGSGNSIVTGDFRGNAAFGDTTLTSAGGRDIFVAKLDANGNFLWVAQAGGTSGEIGHGIATDGSDNSIVTGQFSGTTSFGDTTLTSASGDMFIAKYDGEGNFLWVAQTVGTSNNSGNRIATDGSSNSIVTGYFRGTATFGDTTLTSAGSQDIFIAKLDANGNFLWAAQAGGLGSDVGKGIATDGSGNSIVTGDFGGTATFGDTTLTSAGSQEIFIAKYDGDGNFLWAIRAGGTTSDEGRGIATDGLDNIIVTGHFGGTATFGNTTLTSAGGRDIFVAKLDANGNFLWVEQAGGTLAATFGRGIATDGSGNSIVTGDLQGTGAAFGDITLSSVSGRVDFFIAKLGLVTGIEEEFALPQSFNLSQNYPNPFNPTTKIKYQIPELSLVTIKVYDVLGSEIATLVNEDKPIGSYEVEFDGAKLSSGIYYYQVQANNFIETKKMVLMK